MPRSRPATAFSMVELLVVIVIIAILAALLLPAISIIKVLARQTVCAAHLRQVGIAVASYAEDNQGLIPPQQRESPTTAGTLVYWPYFVADYYDDNPNMKFTTSGRSVLKGCPVFKGGQFNYMLGYGMNHMLNKPTSNQSNSWTIPPAVWNVDFQLSQISRKSSRTLFADSATAEFKPLSSDPTGAGVNQDLARHRQGCNHLFCDLRVSWLNPTNGYFAHQDPTQVNF